jgi:hypothetical protein
MTIIAAAIDETGGYIASDSIASFGDQQADIGSKIRHVRRDLAVGFTGYHVMDSLLSTGALDEPSKLLSDGASALSVGRWWWAVFGYFRERGMLNDTKDMPAWGIAVTPASVISINADGSSFAITDNYFAVGCGREIGTGVLWATRRRKAATRVDMAVRACIKHCSGCGGSIHVGVACARTR